VISAPYINDLPINTPFPNFTFQMPILSNFLVLQLLSCLIESHVTDHFVEEIREDRNDEGDGDEDEIKDLGCPAVGHRELSPA
jgi:hypothetical protein